MLTLEHLDIDGERLRIGHQPGSGTPLVVCAELGANLEMLEPLVQALPDAEILTFDAPGIGQSTLHRPRRMRGYARLLRHLLDARGYHDAVDLLGVGWGGLVVQAFAHPYSQRARRLVLVASSPGHIMFPGRLRHLLRLATPARFASARRFSEVAVRIYGGRARHEPELIRENAEHAILPSRRGYMAQLLAVTGFSSLLWLHRLEQPTLILAGDDDPVVPLVNARVLNLLIARSRLQVVKGGGHLLLITRTDECARAIHGFLARQRSRDELPIKE